MSRFPQIKPWMRWTALTAVILGGIVLAWHITDLRARQELAAAKQALASHGFASRLEEIVPPSIPEDENADSLLREAWRIVSGSNDWENTKPAGVFREIEDRILALTKQASAPAATIREARDELTRLALDPEVARFASQMRLANGRSAWRCNLDYARGPALLLTHISPTRTMVRLLVQHALALSETHETVDAAWEDLRAAFKIADLVADEPTLITFLTGVACRGIIRSAVIDMIEAGRLPADLTPVVDRSLASAKTSFGQFQRAMQVHGLALTFWFDEHYTQGQNWLSAMVHLHDGPVWLKWSDPWLTAALSPLAQPRLTRELAQSLEYHLNSLLALREPGPEMVDGLHTASEAATSAKLFFPEILVPNSELFGRRFLHHLTEQRAFVITLAAFRHRQQHGTWPVSIGDLELPLETTIDACSGQPLILRIEGDSIIAYGFGFDGDDDDGRAVAGIPATTVDGDVVVQMHLPSSLLE